MSAKAPPFQRALNQGPSPNRLESRLKKTLDKPLSLYYELINYVNRHKQNYMKS